MDQRKAILFSSLALIGVLLTSVILDQVSKYHAESQLMIDAVPEQVKLYRSKSHKLVQFGELTPSSMGAYLGLTYVRNQGSAWGALQNWDDKYRVPFFYGVTVIAVIFILFILKSTPHGHRLARLALILVLGGAIGNFLDRLRLSYVIDWIDVKWSIFGWYYDFPVFNIADSCITIGIAFLIIDMFFLERLRKKKLQVLLA